jgi:hypothetical protein
MVKEPVVMLPEMMVPLDVWFCPAAEHSLVDKHDTP